jgi:arylsulfatase A-like enzyme
VTIQARRVPKFRSKKHVKFPIAALALLTFVMLAQPAVAADRPNIVFVLADDMGPGDLACYGGTLAPTPNIDRLAAQGARFTQYYSASPICSPSRVGCTTGMFPGRWRITSFLQERKGNRACEQADYLDPRAPSVARLLKVAGYTTAHFGKWHMGGGRDVTDAPNFAAYGFDEHAGTWESPQPHPDITATNWIWSPQDRVKRWERTGFFIDRTLDFLKRHQGQPAYINVWLDDVHTPWVPDETAQGPETRKETPEKLREVIAETDKQIGRLLDGLRELGIENQTLVIFASDNGALPTFQGQRSAGLRGSKLSLYEGGIHLPFIARWPGHISADRVDETSVISAVDLLPTFCALAGAPAVTAAALDGEDQSDVLLGASRPRKRPLYWEYGRNDEAFRYPQGRDRSPNLAVRDGPWKLLVNADGSDAELYDVVADRSESHNVASDHPDLVKQMTVQVTTWRASLPSALSESKP